MLRKIIHKLFGLFIVGGFIYLAGTVGLSDTGDIGFNALVIRSGVALCFMVAGVIGLKLGGYEF